MQDGDGDQYNNYYPFERVTPSTYVAPAGTWEAAAIRQATITMTMPRDVVQQLVRPPLPQVSLSGPRVRHHGAPTVEEVLATGNQTAWDQSNHHSGGPAGYTGSPRNTSGAVY